MHEAARSRVGQRLEAVFAPQHRAFWLIVLNGVLFQLSWALFDARYVVAAFLTTLTGHEWVVGLANSIQATSMMLPQLYASHQVADGRPRMPYYIRGAHIRWTAMAILVIGVLALARFQVALAVLFLGMLAMMGFGVGLGVVAFGDIVTRTVAPHRRGRCFGLRLALGGLGSTVLGVMVRWLLADGSPFGWPYNYALIFLVSLLFLFTAQLFFMRIDEPPSERRPRPAESFRGFVRHALRVLRDDRAAARYALYRLLDPLATAPMLFITPYMMNRFGFRDDVVGPLVSTGVVAGALSNVVWASVSDRVGNRAVLRGAAMLVLLSLAMLAAAPHVMARYDGGEPGRLTFAWLLGSNAVVQVCMTAINLGRLNYLYELAPPGEVPLYVGLLNTITSPVTAIAPPLVGFMAGRAGYEPVFVVGLTVALWGLLLTLRLDEPRHRSV